MAAGRTVSMEQMLRASSVLVFVVCLVACGTTGHAVQEDVVFAQYTPLSSNAEIARRALPPLTYRRMLQAEITQHLKLAAQAIDLAQEKFDVYVPASPPPAAGYGVVVFIAPWDSPSRPQRWRAALDRHGLIFVAAQRSGNGQRILDRRVPLALLAYHNVQARYAIDPRRVYVWGFSGGSRTAEMAALAFPDVFRGALLNAGADPIDGSQGTFKPPAELFSAFQRTRLVYLTGEDDTGALAAEEVSQASMRASCVFDVQNQIVHKLGHDQIDGVTLDRALDLLEAPRQVDDAALARCNAGLAQALASRVASANAALDRGDAAGAQKLILAIDARFGGQARREVGELDARLAALTANAHN